MKKGFQPSCKPRINKIIFKKREKDRQHATCTQSLTHIPDGDAGHDGDVVGQLLAVRVTVQFGCLPQDVNQGCQRHPAAYLHVGGAHLTRKTDNGQWGLAFLKGGGGRLVNDTKNSASRYPDCFAQIITFLKTFTTNFLVEN